MSGRRLALMVALRARTLRDAIVYAVAGGACAPLCSAGLMTGDVR